MYILHSSSLTFLKSRDCSYWFKLSGFLALFALVNGLSVFITSLFSFDLADNGEVIVTLLPVNEKFPWVTPARFRPELVPEELMAPVLTVSESRVLPSLNDSWIVA